VWLFISLAILAGKVERNNPSEQQAEHNTIQDQGSPYMWPETKRKTNAAKP